MGLRGRNALRAGVRAFPLTSLCLLSWTCLALAAALGASGDVPALWIVVMLPAYLSGLVVHLAVGAVWGVGAEPAWLAVAAVPISLLPPLAADLALRVVVWRDAGPGRRSIRRRPRLLPPV
ncbi:MAG: hypothetical protein KY453_09105 [Gemmatimonadetes bacterium]|nr:hypothetical protein [Gemmatimonadota bacterium]